MNGNHLLKIVLFPKSDAKCLNSVYDVFEFSEKLLFPFDGNTTWESFVQKRMNEI